MKRIIYGEEAIKFLKDRGIEKEIFRGISYEEEEEEYSSYISTQEALIDLEEHCKAEIDYRIRNFSDIGLDSKTGILGFKED